MDIEKRQYFEVLSKMACKLENYHDHFSSSDSLISVFPTTLFQPTIREFVRGPEKSPSMQHRLGFRSRLACRPKHLAKTAQTFRTSLTPFAGCKGTHRCRSKELRSTSGSSPSHDTLARHDLSQKILERLDVKLKTNRQLHS